MQVTVNRAWQQRGAGIKWRLGGAMVATMVTMVTTQYKYASCQQYGQYTVQMF